MPGPLSPASAATPAVISTTRFLESLLDPTHVEVFLDPLHTIRQPGVEGEDVSFEHAEEESDSRLAVLENQVVVLGSPPVTTKPNAS